MVTLEEQLSKARTAHAGLKHSPSDNSSIILKKPPRRIFHNHRQVGPLYGSPELMAKWFHHRDHHLLQELLTKGHLPSRWPERDDYDKATPLEQAWRSAKLLGYSVHDRFLIEKKPSYGESEAWCAARHLLSSHVQCFHNGHKSEVYRVIRDWQKTVRQISSSFIIPNIKSPNNYPYIVDQLWVVQDDGAVRFVALEIDGLQHLVQDEAHRDAQKDINLQAAGYEVYRVAAWWALIDPYRVIAEFLSCCGLFTDAPGFLIFGDAKSPSDYICSKCSKSMVRWDVDWIVYNNDMQPVHSCCLLDDD